MVGSPSWTPPIVYDSLLMSVCGGSRTCCSVSRGRRDRLAEALHARREALRERAAGCADRAPPCCRRARRLRWASVLAALARRDAELRQAGRDLGLLGRGRRGDRPVDLDPVAAGLDLGDDLRHLAFLVHGLKSQAGGNRGDAVEARSRSPGLREGELRPRQEEVVHEVRAGLAELREIGDRRPGSPRRRRAPPPPPNGPPPVSCWARRVTVRSVPMPASGSSVAPARRRAPSRGSRSRSRGRRRPRGRAASGSCGPAAQELARRYGEVEHGLHRNRLA